MNNNKQTTDTVFMVKPINFSYNTETAITNSFQVNTTNNETQEKAFKESNNYIELLKNNNVNVISVSDTLNPHTPDSVFPNNWFSTHSDGTLVLYPMCAKNRRDERKEVFLKAIKENFDIKRTIDLTKYEKENLFLEGTGSMVLDRVNKIAYASLSPRTSEIILDEFCKELGYKKVVFHSFDRYNNLIYHTNVMMSIGRDFVIICLESIKDIKEKENVKETIKQTNKEIIDISYNELEHFAGNMLEITNTLNERLLVMSKTAYDNLSKENKTKLEKKCKIIAPDISCIEINGGGSARCMLAEIYN